MAFSLAIKQFAGAHMRRSRKDNNHGKIVKALNDVFATVLDLSNVGGGAPDIAVGFRGKNYFMEIKDPNAAVKRDRELRQNQVDWHSAWKGQVTTVRTTDEALSVIGARHREGEAAQ